MAAGTEEATPPSLVEAVARLRVDAAPTPSAVEAFALAGLVIPRTLTPEAPAGEAPAPVLSLAETLDASQPQEGASSDAVRAGRYQLGPLLGEGGMGRVWQAWDPELRRVVAVKVLRDDRVSPERLRRLIAEAQLTAQLAHPGIVPVHDLGITEQGQLFFVMPRVDGTSLRTVLDRLLAGDAHAQREWTLHRLLDAFIKAGQAVAYAHSRGALHRDLKPDNVMLGAFGQVLVLDWGLGRVGSGVGAELLGDDTGGATRDGATVGTPGYMSPEQARGELDRLDARSDVWSLGAILYELLTWRRAYTGPSVSAVLHSTLSGPPAHPSSIRTGHGVPEELAECALKALATTPDRRYPDAGALVAAVEGWLDGSRRREQARVHLDDAQDCWAGHRRLRAQVGEVTRQAELLAGEVAGWTPLDDPRKAEWIRCRDEATSLGAAAATQLGRAIAHAERALAFAPGLPEARQFLADVYWSRLEDAERRRDPEGLAYFAERVLEYDATRYGPRLTGGGQLSLRTRPAARVTCQQWERRGLVWRLGEPSDLGGTPLQNVPLPAGSYLLTLRAPGHGDVRYPVHIRRGGHFDAAPVRLLRDRALPPGWIHIPPGPVRLGGDPETPTQLPVGEAWVDGFALAEFPVTAAEYCAFLNHLQGSGRGGEARDRAPRRMSGDGQVAALYWQPVDGRWQVGDRDADGDPCSPRWPVFGVSWHDAVAYCAWRTAQTGEAHFLPTEHQWVRAARGSDDRLFPWGDGFDPQLCRIADTVRGTPQPADVGACASDVSPFGVRDLAGSMRQWCGDPHFDGDPERRPVRGGAWSSSSRLARIANRYGFRAVTCFGYLGFRVARALPG